MEEQIKAKLEQLRGGLQADGGDLELVKIEGKVVYLKLVGHCGSCPFAMMTLRASRPGFRRSILKSPWSVLRRKGR